MMRLLTLTMVAALLAPAAHADITRLSERFERKRVTVGEEVPRQLTCPTGTSLTGGGYALYNLPVDAIPFVVTASYPLGNAWRVELRNVSDSNQPLTFRIYVLCTD